MLSLACTSAIQAMNSEEQAKAIIEAIQSEAQQKWGEDWLASLVRAYCEIESQETGKLIKPVARRSQIARTLEASSATLPVLLRLIAAVGGSLEMTITRKEVRKF